MASTNSVLSQTPALMPQAVDEVADVDEPPENRRRAATTQNFQRTSVKPPTRQSSLLTQAIVGQSDEDVLDLNMAAVVDMRRRRSMTSNVSIASTADLTSDTGFTSPARTNTPSPPIPEMAILRLDTHPVQTKPKSAVGVHLNSQGEVAIKDAPRKRCIQFACAAAKPPPQDQSTIHSSPPSKKTAVAALETAPRRSCIKFACTSRPDSTQSVNARQPQKPVARSPRAGNGELPSMLKKALTFPAPPNNASPRSSTNLKKTGTPPTAKRPRYLRANSNDFLNDASQFHEFASGATRDDDWIRQDPAVLARLTINDTLTKENDFRRLAAEAEEEAELEDEAAEAAIDDDDDDEDEEDAGDVDEEADEDDEDEEDLLQFSDSDGYHTDEETGFAESESDEDEEDDNMIMWTPGRAMAPRPQLATPAMRRPSLLAEQSDSSNATESGRQNRRPIPQRVKPQALASDLPDSTDFVCGTLDEDKPLEEAYATCLAARRNEKLRVIPQDIDPSFPTSGPEDEDEEDHRPAQHDSDENVWMQGEMEDLHHDQDRSRRRRKSEQASPRKYHSPPPKRLHSPPPPKAKTRGRSPQRLFEGRSPRKLRPPAPTMGLTTPTATPRVGARIAFNLGGHPNLTQTKSLPRPAAFFNHVKSVQNRKSIVHDDLHIRGAIDIVKGLEQKRQRRKEKFHQKYCNRARRGQIPERKAQPGKGAERMKELGLLMAGKTDPGNYVLSV